MKHRLYRFAVPDIAEAAGVTEEKVRRDIRSGKFVPGELKQLASYVAVKILENADGEGRDREENTVQR